MGYTTVDFPRSVHVEEVSQLAAYVAEHAAVGIELNRREVTRYDWQTRVRTTDVELTVKFRQAGIEGATTIEFYLLPGSEATPELLPGLRFNVPEAAFNVDRISTEKKELIDSLKPVVRAYFEANNSFASRAKLEAELARTRPEGYSNYHIGNHECAASDMCGDDFLTGPDCYEGQISSGDDTIEQVVSEMCGDE